MLNEYRRNYKLQADLIEGWSKLDRNELCRKYEELSKLGANKSLLDSYISAIVLSFWHILVKTYNKQPAKILSEEDCYECLIDAILFVLDTEPWEDPKQSIYKDERGPERAINITFQQTIINLFVAGQRHKRKLTHDAISLDATLDEANDNDCSLMSFLQDDIPDLTTDIYWKEKVCYYFNKKEYVTSFILDFILTDKSIIEKKSDKYILNSKRLSRLLNSEIDAKYAKLFARTYNVQQNVVDYAVRCLYNIDTVKVERLVRTLVNDIKSERGVLLDN